MLVWKKVGDIWEGGRQKFEIYPQIQGNKYALYDAKKSELLGCFDSIRLAQIEAEELNGGKQDYRSMLLEIEAEEAQLQAARERIAEALSAIKPGDKYRDRYGKAMTVDRVEAILLDGALVIKAHGRCADGWRRWGLANPV